MNKPWLAAAAFVCLLGGVVLGQTLEIQVSPSQGGIVGQDFMLQLTASGGQLPYTWRLTGGQLPPGCRLQQHSGKISGVPSAAGDYHVTVAVSDSNIPQDQMQRDLTIHIIAGLGVDWKEPPAVHGNSISGSAVVTNQTGNEMTVTVIVVAVNQIGRATALGYQHFNLAANATSPAVPFSASPGQGTYSVRADAVAHRPGHHHIYRVSKQHEGLNVSQF